MRKLILVLFTFMAGQVYAGGTSGVGPCGPDCVAQRFFEKDGHVIQAINLLRQQGYTQELSHKQVNQFVGVTNCAKPTPDATWIACERLYVFIRSYSLPNQFEEIRSVSATVRMSLMGINVEIIK